METIITLLLFLLPVIFKLIGKKFDQAGQTEKARKMRDFADMFGNDDETEVEYDDDGQVVDVSFYSGTVASFTYNFEGAVGSASTVYAKCNGITLDSKVISF